MRKKVFVDTNILLSGIFFNGNESKLLSLIDISLYTSDLVIEETKIVIKRKFQLFGAESCRIALEELNYAIMDFAQIVEENSYHHKLKQAKIFLSKEKDSKILAAALSVSPSYFVTGDQDFYTVEIKKAINVCRTREILNDFGIA